MKCGIQKQNTMKIFYSEIYWQGYNPCILLVLLEFMPQKFAITGES
jgi:hypothetical protein